MNTDGLPAGKIISVIVGDYTITGKIKKRIEEHTLILEDPRIEQRGVEWAVDQARFNTDLVTAILEYSADIEKPFDASMMEKDTKESSGPDASFGGVNSFDKFYEEKDREPSGPRPPEQGR